MPKIVDGIIFFNEVGMLDYRLEVLQDVVDYFIIVESPLTFSGKKKGLFFDHARYEKYASKIVHIVVDDIPAEASSAWEREAFQRNAIARGLPGLNLMKDDLLMISDVDEIPNPAVLQRLRETGLSQISSLKQIMYYYNLNSRISHAWYHPRIVPHGLFLSGKHTPERLRSSPTQHIIENGGWHCSYFGSAEFIQTKIRAFSHQEFNVRAFTDPDLIQARVDTGTDIFNRAYISIDRVSYDPDSPDFPPNSQLLLAKLNMGNVESPGNLLSRNGKLKVAFFVRQFDERGTETAIYDYAHYNETILGNETIIVGYTRETYEKLGTRFVSEAFERFNRRFRVFLVSSFSEVDPLLRREGVDVYYTLTHGGRESPPYGDITACRYAVHCVFETRVPHGDVYCSISSQLNSRFGTNIPVVPHIVKRLSDTTETLRDSLGIPSDAIVFGRHGGVDTFDIRAAHAAVYEVATANPGVYFLFLNTRQFGPPLPNIIHLPLTVDPDSKQRFINTCDAYLHARSDGETFGLAIAEFAICDKPIITCRSGTDNAHLEILGDRAYLYSSKQELADILRTFRRDAMDMSDNGYKYFSPERVMVEFNRIVLGLD